MMETDRVLRPLRDAEPAIEQLETYESPAALSEALRATSHAVDRTLRTLLRSDASAPDSIRLTAMSPDQMTLDAVLTELRRRDLISLGLAGRVHELRQAVERADRNEVRASDADNAQDVVRCVRDEVRGAARRAVETPPLAAAQRPPEFAGARDADEALVVERAGSIRRPQTLAIGALVLLAAVVVAILLLARSSDLERGVEAFRENRKGVAEQHFRSALERDEENNTARLYLARILREQGRNQEAGQLLRAAVTTDPRDEAVRRELGYLFLGLNRAEAAAQQFRQAVELNAEEPLNWVGLVEALRRAGDPSADEWLRRAPAEAQQMIRQRGARLAP
jgi:tetratricopeptide (TPR) repeat protein